MSFATQSASINIERIPIKDIRQEEGAHELASSPILLAFPRALCVPPKSPLDECVAAGALRTELGTWHRSIWLVSLQERLPLTKYRTMSPRAISGTRIRGFARRPSPGVPWVHRAQRKGAVSFLPVPGATIAYSIWRACLSRPATCRQPMSRRTPIFATLGIAGVFLGFAGDRLRAYFTPDEMMNLYGAWFRPLVASGRPVGDLFYRVLFAAAGLNPLPYRIACYRSEERRV